MNTAISFLQKIKIEIEPDDLMSKEEFF